MNSVTGFRVPAGVDGTAVVSQMRTRYGITIAGGQDHLKGKIVRIAHVGYFSEFDIITAISGLEMTLSDLGFGIRPGAGVAAAQATFAETRRDLKRVPPNARTPEEQQPWPSQSKVLIADDMSKKAVEVLSEAGFSVEVKTGMKPEELAAVIGEYHGIGIRSASKITAATLANPGKLKIIGRAGVGVDNIDVKAATEKGILVINTPQGNAAAAAELAIGLMFALARKIPQAAGSMKQGRLGEEEVHGRRRSPARRWA